MLRVCCVLMVIWLLVCLLATWIMSLGGTMKWWRRRRDRAHLAELAASQEADEFLAELDLPHLRPGGLLILDESPWAEARLILEADAPEYPDSSWGRAQLGRFLYWKNGVAAGIREWQQEVARG